MSEDRKQTASVALIGNPNVGKSTIFNRLTGSNQHTGNWPGKTVEISCGKYQYKGKTYEITDLPGTYSLLTCSEEERVALEYLQKYSQGCVVVVADATCLERNLVLVQQILEWKDRVILCVNLLDEAQRKQIVVDLASLSRELGIPVVGTAAGSGEGLEALQESIRKQCDGFSASVPKRILRDPKEMLDCMHQCRSDQVTELFARRASEVAHQAVLDERKHHTEPSDRIIWGSYIGFFFLFFCLLGIFWITIQGANLPSAVLQRWFEQAGSWLSARTTSWPWWLRGLLLDGVYGTAADVVSVMLPPMAIFFPLFTILEDLGVLPRAAFLMDHSFSTCGSCGKQALTMAMGFGCNAAGVVGCRIIASPKDRLLAIVTNALVPCNGRFPTMIALSVMFFSKNSAVTALILAACVLFGILATLDVTRLLSKTVFRKTDSAFILEIPPYRLPHVKTILIRSLLDRTLYVLGRAVAVAAPAGAILWILQQLHMQGEPALSWMASLLEPAGQFLGMNGIILLGFLLSFPANELLLPSVLMILGSEATQLPLESILVRHGWTWQTALCVMVFILFHWPCSTTCLTIRKETGQWRWVFLSILIPTLLGIFFCGLLAKVL